VLPGLETLSAGSETPSCRTYPDKHTKIELVLKV